MKDENIKEILEELKEIPLNESCAYCLEDYQCKALLDYITNLQEELEKNKNIIERIQSIYTSMQFSAPENMYVFINQLGEVLEKIKGSDK